VVQRDAILLMSILSAQERQLRQTSTAESELMLKRSCGPPCMLSPCDREKENSSRIVASAKKELIVAKIPQTAVENSPVPFSPLTVPRIATCPCASCRGDTRAISASAPVPIRQCRTRGREGLSTGYPQMRQRSPVRAC
jgi:hypothetical protein